MDVCGLCVLCIVACLMSWWACSLMVTLLFQVSRIGFGCLLFGCGLACCSCDVCYFMCFRFGLMF